ncbi:hypothetical protein HRI_005116500 [Hibiscus trionum]|uniref:Uncharacterized protein n=1 Tax=Hibiscus trionum TaxID=183268 RepID=A0A9W7JK98_HIBTR|nr:hypothetical protein HRI_005116500 [Hibiscus trionum]
MNSRSYGAIVWDLPCLLIPQPQCLQKSQIGARQMCPGFIPLRKMLLQSAEYSNGERLPPWVEQMYIEQQEQMVA